MQRNLKIPKTACFHQSDGIPPEGSSAIYPDGASTRASCKNESQDGTLERYQVPSGSTPDPFETERFAGEQNKLSQAASLESTQYGGDTSPPNDPPLSEVVNPEAQDPPSSLEGKRLVNQINNKVNLGKSTNTNNHDPRPSFIEEGKGRLQTQVPSDDFSPEEIEIRPNRRLFDSRTCHDGSTQTQTPEKVPRSKFQAPEDGHPSSTIEVSRSLKSPQVRHDPLESLKQDSKRERKRLRKETKKARKKERREKKKRKQEKRTQEALTSKQNVSKGVIGSGLSREGANVGSSEAETREIKSEKTVIPLETPPHQARCDSYDTRLGKYETLNSGKDDFPQRITCTETHLGQDKPGVLECRLPHGVADTCCPSSPPPMRLLCSESFIETWGEVVAKLATGEWASSRGDQVGVGNEDPIVRTVAARKICFLDTSLVDVCGVDIEIPNRGGIIVSSLSSWQRSGVSILLKHIVELASTSRYRFLEVFLCADIDLNATITGDITKLQNAVLRQRGNPPTVVYFRMVSPRSISACIAHSLSAREYSTDNCFNEIEARISDDRVRERLLFLLSLIPTLTVGGALQCLALDGDDGSRGFQRMLGKKENERKRVELAAQSNRDDYNDLHPGAMMQLSFALNAFLGKRMG
jgi:hypothetical protein